MDDMQTFERRVAGEVIRGMGPPEPVDDAAIFDSITITQSPKWRLQSMFNATKFVVAGVIVALFGGFLLAGVLTQQPSDDRLPAVGASASATIQAEPTDTATTEPEPTAEAEADSTTTNPDLLPGVDLVTQEVEPGVLRVVSDGVRDLSREVGDGRAPVRSYESGYLDGSIVAGRDGSAWLFRPEGFFRFGEEQTHPWGGDQPEPSFADDIEVGQDGTVWRRAGDLYSFDGESWVVQREKVVGFDMMPDGTVWAMTANPDSLARLEEGGWTEYGECPLRREAGESCFFDEFGDFMALPSVPGWVLNENPDVDFAFLFSSADGSLNWLTIDTQGEDGVGGGGVGGEGLEVELIGMDDEGGYWAYQLVTTLVPGVGSEGDGGGTTLVPFLTRSDGAARSVYSVDAGVPVLDGRFLVAAPDGSAWLTPVHGYGSRDGLCDGLANFDGNTWTYYLRDKCIVALAVAPDGKVWAQAADEEVEGAGYLTVHTYVITPEAAAVTE